jgi:hypothetical protein
MRKLGLVIVCATLGGAIAAGATTLQPKMLNGGADEVMSGAMRLPDVADVGQVSRSALLPVSLIQDGDGRWAWSGEVAVDSADELAIVALPPPGIVWDVVVQAPGEAAVRMSDAAFRKDVIHHEAWIGIEGTGVSGEALVFERATTGAWQVEVSGPAARLKDARSDGFLLVSSRGPYRLYTHLASNDLLAGHEVGVVAWAFRSEGANPTRTRPQPITGVVATATLAVRKPDGSQTTVDMFDDGAHADGAAHDGVWGGVFVADQAGSYTGQVIARGSAPGGSSWMRTSEHFFPVESESVWLTGEARTEPLDGQRLAVELGVRLGLAAPETLQAYAEVWGVGGDGDPAPAGWLAAMVTPQGPPDDAIVVVSLDGRWLARAGVSAPLEIRDVRLMHPNTHVALARAARLATDSRGLPPSADGPAVKAITQDMLMGPAPPLTAADKAADHKLILVHGYCSSDAWNENQFTDDIEFKDFNANRSNDDFARRIRDFASASGVTGCGIVAHSQGGLASLHLYSYYWSCLDYSTSGSRMIQSVGSPYQGTNLAGIIATIGSWFGIQCGSQYDLTYSGASAWLAGIPSWARSQVHYSTTSFTDKWWRYDYCQIASDLLLSDPDDGVVEKWSGQLSGANNRGHKTGWCHTSGMRDPAQTTDSSRNADMNANARR